MNEQEKTYGDWVNLFSCCSYWNHCLGVSVNFFL